MPHPPSSLRSKAVARSIGCRPPAHNWLHLLELPLPKELTLRKLPSSRAAHIQWLLSARKQSLASPTFIWHIAERLRQPQCSHGMGWGHHWWCNTAQLLPLPKTISLAPSKELFLGALLCYKHLHTNLRASVPEVIRSMTVLEVVFGSRP